MHLSPDRIYLASGAMAAAVAILASFVRLAVLGAEQPVGPDFTAFMLGGRAFLTGAPLYDTAALELAPFGQTFKLVPPVALLIAPFAALDPVVASLIWRVLILAAVVTSCLIVGWALDLRPGDGRLWWTVALGLSLDSVVAEVADGQIQWVLLLCAATAAALFLRNRWIAGGALLASAAAVKVFPAVLLLPAILRWQWRAVAGFAGAALGLAALSLAVFGVPTNRTWLEAVVPELAAATGWAANQSILGVLLRAVQGEPTGNALFRPSPPDAGLAAIAGALAMLVLGLTAAAVLLRPAEGSRRMLAIHVSAAMAAGLLVIPTAWIGYGLLLVIPLAVTLSLVMAQPSRISRPQAGLIWLAAGCFSLYVVSGLALPGWLALILLPSALLTKATSHRTNRPATVLTLAGFGILLFGWPVPLDGWLLENRHFVGVLWIWLGFLAQALPARAPAERWRPIAAAAGLVALLVLGTGYLTAREMQRAATWPQQAQLPGDAVAPDPPAVWFEGITLAATSQSTTTVRPGETVDIGLYWLPSKTLETDYTVFVHLLNQEINVACVRKDEPPVGGRLPSTLWRPGRYVYDHHLVPIPPSCPPGTYSIIVGLYSGPSADRLRMQSSPHTDYTTGTITVLPG